MTPPQTRTERISVNLTPGVVERLDRYRFDRRWSRSTAVAVLVERGLDREEHEHHHDEEEDHDD
jgi:metal-responsive CopG/Arc/MetJ family transcriptional regulator